MDGIWPPELVPLFLRDGQFPEWVDADERNKRKWSAISLLQIQKRLRSSLRGGGGGGGGGGGSYRSSTGQRSQSEMSNRKSSAINRGSARSTLRTISSSHQPPDTTPPLPPERLSVRFEVIFKIYQTIADNKTKFLIKKKNFKSKNLKIQEHKTNLSPLLLTINIPFFNTIYLFNYKNTTYI